MRQMILLAGAGCSLFAVMGHTEDMSCAGNRMNGLPNESLKTVRLKKPATFPAVMGGKVVGSIQLPVGTGLKLLSIDSGVVVVEYQGATQRLKAEATDVMERVAAAQAVLASASAAAGGLVRSDAVPSVPGETIQTVKVTDCMKTSRLIALTERLGVCISMMTASSD